MTDVITELTGLGAGDLARLRSEHRGQVASNAQESYDSFFVVSEADAVPTLTLDERLFVALSAAVFERYQPAISWYENFLRERPGGFGLAAIARGGLDRQPGWSASRRLRGLHRHTELLIRRPSAATASDLNAALSSGIEVDELVLASQIVSFVAYQVRAAHGLRTVATTEVSDPVANAPVPDPAAATETLTDTDQGAATAFGERALLKHPAVRGLEQAYTSKNLIWHAWLDPVDPENTTAARAQAIADSVWPRSDYFRLLAYHPESLASRTRLDQAIFLASPGIARGERELAATVVSRVNGCRLCASVHARFTEKLTGRTADVQRLLHEGLTAEFEPVWSAIVQAAAATAQSPQRFGSEHVQQMRSAGLSDTDIVDLVEAAAFFSWANRLMLSLGAPQTPGAADAGALADQDAADQDAVDQNAADTADAAPKS